MHVAERIVIEALAFSLGLPLRFALLVPDVGTILRFMTMNLLPSSLLSTYAEHSQNW
jgi:hypothetical protein